MSLFKLFNFRTSVNSIFARLLRQITKNREMAAINGMSVCTCVMLVLVAWPVAFLCATLYIWISPFGKICKLVQIVISWFEFRTSKYTSLNRWVT